MNSPAEGEKEGGDLPSGTLVAGYRLTRKLGAGEMGSVYQASTATGERVAVKILKLGGKGAADLEKRFAREAALCSALKHPNVVSVRDHGVHEGSPFLVMNMLEGDDLEAWLARTGPLQPEVAVEVMLQACAGVRAAHEAKIIHRDLKPANVFLDERPDGSIDVIVCDFGVAKVFDEDGALTASGAVLGTPLYMAPEQLMSSKSVDARCDVWALGMVLYHALAGRAALDTIRSIGDLVLALRLNQIPPLQERAPWVSPALARVVHAALLPIDKRIPSVRELEDALLRWGPNRTPLSRSVLVPLEAELKSHVATRASLPTQASELVGQGDSTLMDGEQAKPSEPDLFVGRALGDRYRVVAKIGSGGMGTVYEAVDVSPGAANRIVAIKVMQVEPGAKGVEAVRRFLREAKASARIDSPHVTRFLDSGVDAVSGSPFIVMERLEGRDLATHLAANAPLDPEPAVALFLQACNALRSAHALGIVHRDIKPSNLFLHEPDGDKITLKVCDFGIAKQLTQDGGVEASTELTHSGGLLGSPLYMSPEQAKSSKNVDQRSDVFSLSLTIHEALSGNRPWSGCSSMGEIIVAVCTENVPSLRRVAPWVPAGLAAAVARGLARDVVDRFQTIAELESALEPFAQKTPLAQQDLVGVRSEVRAAAPSPLAETAVPDSLGKATSDPVSMTAGTAGSAPPPPRRNLAIAAALVVLLGGGSFGVYRATTAPQSNDSAAPLGGPAIAPEITTTAPVPVSSSSAAPSSATPADVAPKASASAILAGATGAKPRKRTDPSAPDAGVAVGIAPSARATASAVPTVGRGVTATDLPP